MADHNSVSYRDITPDASVQGAKPSSGGFCFLIMPQRTYVYIDGFNLYYGAVRGTPYRWLDLDKLCGMLLPQNDIRAIKYFTALVKPRPDDPQQPIRQQTYLRALKTIPHCSVIRGHFLTHRVRMPLVKPTHTQKYADVIKTEEKGSDVNLATHLLCDGFHNVYDVAVVISNDSDLVEPIRIVAQDLNKMVGILNPHKHSSRQLSKYARFQKKIRKGVLKASQFSQTLQDVHGSFHKPASW